MPNKTFAHEWIELAEHNLKATELLFAANHFTDVIGCEVQQSIEKSLKALLAYRNVRIPKSHKVGLFSIDRETIECPLKTSSSGGCGNGASRHLATNVIEERCQLGFE